LGEIYRLLCDYPQAIYYYQLGVEGAQEHFLGLDNLYRLGLTRCYAGDSEGADQVNLTIPILQRSSIQIGVISAQLCQALIAASEQKWEQVRNLAHALEAQTRINKIDSYHINALCLLGEVAFAEEKYQEALKYYHQAIDKTQAIQNPWMELKAQAGVDRALQQQGSTTTAPTQRIAVLLKRLDTHISLPEIRPSFEKFQQQVTQRTCVKTDTL